MISNTNYERERDGGTKNMRCVGVYYAVGVHSGESSK